MSDTAAPRLAALDGLRGWAALLVVVFHMSWELFGTVFPSFHVPLLAGLLNGDLTVSIFFALSGYVLTRHRWGRNDNPNIISTLLRRYMRLELPILASVAVVLVLMLLGLNFAAPIGQLIDRVQWLETFTVVQPDVDTAIRFATVDVFKFVRLNEYNPFLWTMTIELWGSVIVLAASQWPFVQRLAIIGLFAGGYYLGKFNPVGACLPAGALLAMLESWGLFFTAPPGRRGGLVFLGIFIAAIGLATWFHLAGFSPWATAPLGIVLVIAALRSPQLQAVLATPISRWLGHISFPLYLMQFPVLLSLVSWLIITAAAHNALTPLTAMGIAIVGVVASVAAAWAFLPIERFTLRLIRRRRPQP